MMTPAKCEPVTRWLDDLADDYYSGQGLGLQHGSWTRDGRADGGSNTAERNLHANRSWTCSDDEEGVYAFDCWTPEEGLSRGYAYCRIEDAHYARNVEISSRNNGSSDQTIACSTVDEFVRLTFGKGV